MAAHPGAHLVGCADRVRTCRHEVFHKVNAQAGVEDQRTSVRGGPALSAVTVSSRREKASFGVVWLCLNPLLRVALAGTVTASTGWESLDCLPLPQLPPGPQRPWLGTMCFQGSGINYLPSLRYLSFSHLGWSSSLWGQACSAFSAEHVLIVGMRAPSGFSLAALQFHLAEPAILSVLGGICDTVAFMDYEKYCKSEVFIYEIM